MKYSAATIVAAVLGSLAIGAATADAATPARYANGVGAPIRWAECDPRGQGVECAHIKVPLDWDAPRGRTIDLALVRHMASKPDQRIGTMFVNPGGPGDTGVGLVQGAPDDLDAMGGGRFDVVSWDPRGTQGSTRVNCFRDQTSEARFWANANGGQIPLGKAASGRQVKKFVELARRCGEVSSWLLPHVSTADSARDMEHLRQMIAKDKLTYVGLSYGSYLGQVYANMYPKRVRAMLLEGIVDAPVYAKSAEARSAGWISGGDKIFSEFVALCQKAGPEECALAGKRRTAAQRIRDLRARLLRGPIPAPGTRPHGSSPEPLTYTDFLASQFQPMRSPAGWPQNGSDLMRAVQGDGSALKSGSKFFTTPIGWANVMVSNAIQCADAPAAQPVSDWWQMIERNRRLSWTQGIIHAWWDVIPCAAWPTRGVDTYRGPWNAKTETPILLINQLHEPNSPIRNARRAERYLGNAVLVTLDGYGHLPFQDPSECVTAAETAYLTDLVVPAKGTVCQADRQPFSPLFGQPLAPADPPATEGG